MSCCGQKRASMTMRHADDTRPSRSSATSGGAGRSVRLDRVDGVTLHYVGPGPVTLRGPRSGRLYQAAATGDLLFVHPDDVDALLRMRVFARAATR